MIVPRSGNREIFKSSSLDISNSRDVRDYRDMVVKTVVDLATKSSPFHPLINGSTVLSDQVISKSAEKADEKWLSIYNADLNGSARKYLDRMINNLCINFGRVSVDRRENLRANNCDSRLRRIHKTIMDPEGVDNFIYQNWLDDLLRNFKSRDRDIMRAFLEQDPLDVKHLMLKWSCSKSTIYGTIEKIKKKLESKV